MNKLYSAAAIILLLLSFHSCKSHSEHETLLQKLKSHDQIPDSSAINASESLNHLYDQVRKVSYVDSVHSDTFYIKDRRPNIQHFPCSECHVGSTVSQGTRPAHFGLTLKHAESSVMDCATCHGKGMQHNTLATFSGKPVPFEYSFQVCAQCHFQQANDFMGGAHGKRLLGWQGDRIIQNCTECHNPHAPAIPSRWPSSAATRRGLE